MKQDIETILFLELLADFEVFHDGHVSLHYYFW